MKLPPNALTVFVLALCQALTMTCSALVISITALVGEALAPAPGYSTLPLALQFLGLMATSPVASQFMQRYGRRAGFTQGSIVGIGAGLLGVVAILNSSYALYCVAAVLTGAFLGHAMYYRFAAADAVPDSYRSRAISLVMAGGVLAAVLGPQLADWSRHLFDTTYAGGYLTIAALCALALVLVQIARLPKPASTDKRADIRPLHRMVRQPALLMAIFCGMAAYGGMNLVMSVTPPAMISHDHGFSDAAFVIQWHVLAMFAPSFFTGHLIHRFGVRPILALGALLMLACVSVNLTGTGLLQFIVALVLLGLGWNFLFVGGTTLVTDLYPGAEKAKAQALNDVLVFGTVACSSLASGYIFDTLGWTAVNLSIIAPLVLALAGIALVSKPAPAPADTLSAGGSGADQPAE